MKKTRIRLSLFSLVLALVLFGLTIRLTGRDPLVVYWSILTGSFGSTKSFLNVLAYMLPLIMTGLGAAVAFQSGVFNIGGEGQVLVGGLASVIVGLTVPLPAPWGWLLALLAGFAAGALWALLPTLFAGRNLTSLSVATIMMNSIAALLTEYIVKSYFQRPGASNTETVVVNEGSILPRIFPSTQFNYGILVALYRIVYYSWEFDTLQSFYRDLLRLPQMYGWYTSPVDRGCKFKIGDNRLELICRHPTLPQGPAGMRLEAKDIELCYANLKKEPRVTVIRPLQSHPWGEYSFCIKDPVGNWVEVYQRSEQYRPMGADDGGCYFTDEYTAILFAEDLEKITAFYRDSMQMPVVTSWDRGPEDRGCRLRSAGGFTDIRQKTENTPQGPALTTIEAEDVNACFAWLESRDDVEVLLGLTDTWYGDRIFQICDEEKNVVEVLAYRRNMKNRDTLPQEDPS